MAWTAPMTAVANTAFTAAQFNTYVRDNFLECAPAKATTSGSFITVNGTNQIVERTPVIAFDSPNQTTTSTSYVELSTSLSAVVTSGARAFMSLACRQTNNTSGKACFTSVDITGSSSITANDINALIYQSSSANDFNLSTYSTVWTTGYSAGTSTFTVKHRVDGGTGTFTNRRLTIIPF